MLDEPTPDAARLALDRALAKALVARIAAGPTFAPDAEAIALRQALAQAWRPEEEAILRAVWGRITALKVPALIVAGPEAAVLSADRYGLSCRAVADGEAALAEVTVGAQAMIDLGGGRPWWGRLLARRELRVVGALPDDRRALPRALLVSNAPSGPTGDDRTFWVTDSAHPDARIVAALAECGLAARLLTAAGGLKLYALAGYVQAEDGRLTDAPGSLSGVIGSAPIY